MQQYIIANQPRPMELAEIKKSENKIESDLTTPLILLQHLQSLHIVMTVE